MFRNENKKLIANVKVDPQVICNQIVSSGGSKGEREKSPLNPKKYTDNQRKNQFS